MLLPSQFKDTATCRLCRIGLPERQPAASGSAAEPEVDVRSTSLFVYVGRRTASCPSPTCPSRLVIGVAVTGTGRVSRRHLRYQRWSGQSSDVVVVFEVKIV